MNSTITLLSSRSTPSAVCTPRRTLQESDTFTTTSFRKSRALMATSCAESLRVGTCVTVSGCSSVFLVSSAWYHSQLAPQDRVEGQSVRSKHRTLWHRDRLGWLGGLGKRDSPQQQASKILLSSLLLNVGSRQSQTYENEVHLVLSWTLDAHRT